MAAGMMDCASTEDSDNKKSHSNKKKEGASVVACLIGLEVSELLNKKVVHTSIALERFRVAHCVYSGLVW